MWLVSERLYEVETLIEEHLFNGGTFDIEEIFEDSRKNTKYNIKFLFMEFWSDEGICYFKNKDKYIEGNRLLSILLIKMIKCINIKTDRIDIILPDGQVVIKLV